jgi:probable rRNA maturation factor
MSNADSYLITVQIEPRYEVHLDAEKLHQLAAHVLRAEGIEGPVEVGVVITTDEEIRALNRQYLGHDYETDVLSFGYEDLDNQELLVGSEEPDEAIPQSFVSPPERPPYLGDVVISYERAIEQAPEYGHSAEAEVATLLVHGLLHLLGYDDQTETARDRMHARQQELISILDFGY